MNYGSYGFYGVGLGLEEGREDFEGGEDDILDGGRREGGNAVHGVVDGGSWGRLAGLQELDI